MAIEQTTKVNCDICDLGVVYARTGTNVQY